MPFGRWRLTKGPWTDRILLLAKSLGWSVEKTANELGFKKREGLYRIMRGARAQVKTVLRLQALEQLHAEAIANYNPHRRIKRPVLFPPKWVECLERWYPGTDEGTLRPADLAALGTNSADAASVLTGRYRPENFPGRTLKAVDFTAAGRLQLAKNRPRKSRFPKFVRVGLDGSYTPVEKP